MLAEAIKGPIQTFHSQDLDTIFCGHLTAMLAFLQFYVAGDGIGWHEASLLAATASGKGTSLACCIAVKSSVPQGMIVCFDKRGWLVCRNSGDTEGCRESVMKQSRWRERLRWGRG